MSGKGNFHQIMAKDHSLKHLKLIPVAHLIGLCLFPVNLLWFRYFMPFLHQLMLYFDCSGATLYPLNCSDKWNNTGLSSFSTNTSDKISKLLFLPSSLLSLFLGGLSTNSVSITVTNANDASLLKWPKSVVPRKNAARQTPTYRRCCGTHAGVAVTT